MTMLQLLLNKLTSFPRGLNCFGDIFAKLGVDGIGSTEARGFLGADSSERGLLGADSSKRGFLETVCSRHSIKRSCEIDCSSLSTMIMPSFFDVPLKTH